MIKIKIDQSGKPSGVAGVAREDLALASAVTLLLTGGVGAVAYQWSILYAPPNEALTDLSAATLSAPAASSTTITPDNTGTYLIQCKVDQGFGLGARDEDVTSITFYAGPTLSTDPTRLPRRRLAAFEATQHNAPDSLESANSNGYAREMERWFRVIEAVASGVYFPENGSAYDTTLIGLDAAPLFTAGANVVAVGKNALPSLHSGSDIVAIGPKVGSALSGGGGLVLIGAGNGSGDGVFKSLTGAGHFIGITSDVGGEHLSSAYGVFVANGTRAKDQHTCGNGIEFLSAMSPDDTSISALYDGVYVMIDPLPASGQVVDRSVLIGRRIASGFAGSFVNSVLLGNIPVSTLTGSAGGGDLVLIGAEADVPAAGQDGFVSIARAFVSTLSAGDADPGYHRGDGTAYGFGHRSIESILSQPELAAFRAYLAASADTKPILGLHANGTSNAAAVVVHVGSRDPNGQIVAEPGTLYFRASGASSTIYQVKTATASSTWTAVGSGGGGGGGDVPISPTALAADTDDWSPTGLASATTLRVATTADVKLTGLSASGVTEPRKLLINTTAFNLTIAHESTSSAAGNRLVVPGNADLMLGPGDSVWLYLDATTNRWRVC